MSEKQKKVLETFNRLILHLSELEQEKLLSFGEGMAFMTRQREQQAGRADEPLVRVEEFL